MTEINSAPLQAAAASAGHYHDAQALSRLKLASKENPEAAAREVATQFEAMFIQMMLKSMRDAVPKGGLFNSNDMETYTEMADQQIAVNLSKSGGVGLAEVITRQLTLGRNDIAREVAPTSSDVSGEQALEIANAELKFFDLKPLTESGQ
ncbi:MAG: rod-binding protein [Betaproteobacteria bacterium]|jgi:flagellar protein FlgJ